MSDLAIASASHKRVLEALELREPDRVPTMDLMLEPDIVGAILGKKPSLTDRLFAPDRAPALMDWSYGFLRRFPETFEAIVSTLIRDYLLKFDLDAVRAAIEMGYDSAWIAFTPIMRNRDSRSMTDIHGRLLDVAVSESGFQANPVYREGLIKSESDWNAWNKRPLLALPEKANLAFREIVKGYGSRIFLFGMATYGIFENIWQPMGFDRFVVATRKEKRLIARMIKFYEDLFCMLIEAMADAGMPAVVYTDDLAYKSGPMLSPKMIRELFEDSYRRLTETAHALGIKLVMHSCGNVTSLLEFFADCGFDAVQSLEPTAGVSLKEAKALVGDRICLIGNLDVSELMVSGTREQVFDAVRQSIEDAGRGGGFILSPAHNHSRVSIERLRWMVEAAREYGTYPKG